MSIENIKIIRELKHHIPLTFLGTLTGVIIIIILSFNNYFKVIELYSENIFYILHPTHIFLSAIVTTSLYLKYNNKWLLAIFIGYTGSVGIASLSDSLIPFIGETLLDLPNKGLHLGLIEKPIIINFAAIAGIIIGFYKELTKFPHFGHVLISTWASLFHIIIAIGVNVNIIQIIFILIFLFLAVWIPCCTSDIVYPLIFKSEK